MDQRNFAKGLRKNMTDAERLIWKQLRAHRLSGQKFRRQQPIGPYVVDFVHFGARLIIECDGGQHNESTKDHRRDTWLRQQGFQLLRFWNHEIMNQTESVLTTIFSAITPLSPCGREGKPGMRLMVDIDSHTEDENEEINSNSIDIRFSNGSRTTN
ncbi:MAG: DUF559 domain-containing protein [Candidatus Thiodiazotropha sp. 6PLUC2]